LIERNNRVDDVGVNDDDDDYNADVVDSEIQSITQHLLANYDKTEPPTRALRSLRTIAINRPNV